MKIPFLIWTLLFLLVISACSTPGPRRNIEGPVPVDMSATEIPESQLLNVSIEVFDPGVLPEDPEDANGLSMDIREAEARYMPELLRATMEKTGYWGAVRVVPAGSIANEVLVKGTILASNGELLDLEITALDATGRQWFNKIYRDGVEASFYQANAIFGDAFQPLYNSIANDLAAHLKTLNAPEIVEIRRVSELQFAADIAPDAYDDYLEIDDDGRLHVVHLPSENDPMYGRVQAIRDRDLMMIDTLNGHFDSFQIGRAHV